MRVLRAALRLSLASALLWACSGDDGSTRSAGKRQIFVAEALEADATEESEQDYRYDPTGKPDPFKSFLKQIQLVEGAESLSPLERFDLSQLTVTGIIWSTEDPRALVEDPTGKGYIVSEGAGIGKNKGRIVRIDDNRVVVKETYVDFHHKATNKEVDLYLYERHGG
ncbi:MAG: pilus assembly protein PilP [Myxococcota bacterium]